MANSAKFKSSKKIRNELAHNHRATPDDQKIKDLAKLLKYAIPASEVPGISAKDSFSTSAITIILAFTNRAYYVRHKRRTLLECPGMIG